LPRPKAKQEAAEIQQMILEKAGILPGPMGLEPLCQKWYVSKGYDLDENSEKPYFELRRYCKRGIL